MEYVSSTVSRLVQILVMTEDLLLWMLWWEAKDATGLGALGKRCGSVSQLNTKISSVENICCQFLKNDFYENRVEVIIND